MKKTNKQIATLSILGVILLLLVSTGVTFAYFTANITGAETGTTVTVTGGSMTIAYFKGADISVSNIAPGPGIAGTKTFTVTGNNTTTLTMPYKLTFNVLSNTFTTGTLTYKMTSTNTGSNGTIIPSITTNQNITTGSPSHVLGTGNFVGTSGANKVHTYKFDIYFLDSGGNQNNNQGKSLTARIDIVNG